MVRYETLHGYVEQDRHAFKIMSEYRRFAESIGCRVYGDSIESFTTEQVKALEAKWAELNP